MTTFVPHTQVPVKVNAWVDEGIAPLVEALCEHPDVVTYSSCEGHDGETADIYFGHRSGDGTDDHDELVLALALSLAKIMEPLTRIVAGRRCCELALTVRWATSSSWRASLILTVRDTKARLPLVARRLRAAIRKSLRDAV